MKHAQHAKLFAYQVENQLEKIKFLCKFFHARIPTERWEDQRPDNLPRIYKIKHTSSKCAESNSFRMLVILLCHDIEYPKETFS